jgi:uncharacterized SAM-binding protein YcdF (DUF218 family)
MLVAIFILLLIVFFPLLSLLMGVGFMVVLVKFWWVFLILFGCLIFCRYIDKKEASEKKEAKLRKQQEAIIGAIRGSQGGQSNNYTKLSFKGVPELSNDSYVLFITKKYAIEKNEVLGKYVLKEKLYNSIDDALGAGHELNNLEMKAEQSRAEQRARDYEQAALRAAQANREYRVKLIFWAKITLIFILAILLLWTAFFQTIKYFESKSLIALAASQAIEDAKPHKDLYTMEIKGLLKTKDSWGYIGDVSENTGDFRPYFFPINSPVGKKILAACSDGDYCKLSGSMDFIDLPKVINAMDIGENSGSFEIISVKYVSK